MKESTQKCPLISICIPTYNGQQYIEQTLKSINEQDYSNIEILIVDDHSTDDTLDIVKAFAQIHSDLDIKILYNQQNLGLVRNWNRCIELSNGSWIKFLFQDDIMEKECIAELADATSDETPLIFCRREFFYEAGVSEQVLQTYRDIPNIDCIFPGKETLSSSDIANGILRETRNFLGEPTSTLIHKSLFSRFGLFNVNMVQLCDLEYWIRVGLNTGIRYVPKTMVRFRVHPSSTSSTNGSKRQYRSSLLDRLILLHEYAYNPHYQPLREYAKKNHKDRNFKKELARKAAWLKSHGNALSQEDGKQHDTLHDWQEVIAAYPLLENSPYLIPYKFKTWLDTTLLWRINSK